MKQAILILGMHRSGTSALTGSFTLMGATGPKTPIGANDSNPKGHFESVLVARFNDRILHHLGSCWLDWRSLDLSVIADDVVDGWCSEAISLIAEEFDAADLIVLKDPRICRLVPLWLHFLEAAGYEVKIILPLRQPLDVALSLGARNRFSLDQGLILWLSHVLDAERDTRAFVRVIRSARAHLKDWRTTRHLAVTQLGIDLAPADAVADQAIDDFLQRGLLSRSDENLPQSEIAVLCSQTYKRLKAAGKHADRIANLDDIRAKFELLIKPYTNVAVGIFHEMGKTESQKDRAREAALIAREAILAERRKIRNLRQALADSRATTVSFREKYQAARDALKAPEAPYARED